MFVSWRECYEQHGCPPPELEWWTSIIGTADGHDLLAPLRERLGDAFDHEAADAARRARRDELLAAEEVTPGIMAWLEQAADLDLPVAVASSSGPDWVEGHLVRLELRGRFAALACFGPGLKAKPAPDLYLAACESLGVDPSEALAVEDAPHGVAAAKAAGLRCIAVPRGLTAGLDFGAADLVVESLEHLSLTAAAQRVGFSARW